MRAQFCAVSLIRSRFTGVSRSIGEPHTLHGMLLFLTSTVTSFSVCWPQPGQRIRRIVRSAAENATILASPGTCGPYRRAVKLSSQSCRMANVRDLGALGAARSVLAGCETK